ncbi:hypothetical protein JHD48_04310 [Sulfurimonas sp. SAG-AH-194-I05]|nr:hypothetical protein [Sulfurimonas sp. SAG-AH-194-I05]MDF1874952.1 hypothetical protein [Sulfurimonas sp. SAG-AH-194-I05]
MAIFTAGCIESTNDPRKIRNNVYDLARHDLDSPAMKISVRKSPTCINFIAFLPKDKIIQENILQKVSECKERTVVIFELDYKHVGVVCEYSRIVDYILDKPKEFAEERSYKVAYVDNSKGVRLVSFNLDNIDREAKAGFISLGFTILLTSSIFFSGYSYMQDTQINIGNKDNLSQQYKDIVKKEFQRSEKIVKKVDLVRALEDIERLTKATHATLEQVKYTKKNFCVKVKTLQMEPFIILLPTNVKIVHKNRREGRVEYCYEKI